MRLFHALFDHFFTIEECQNAVPFGRHGNNPSGKEGKRVLDRKKVDGILSKFFSKSGSVFSGQDSGDNDYIQSGQCSNDYYQNRSLTPKMKFIQYH